MSKFSMDIKLQNKIINCQNEIDKNNTLLIQITRRNKRLFDSLVAMMRVIPKDKADRYKKELASDNWKKTSYWKRV